MSSRRDPRGLGLRSVALGTALAVAATLTVTTPAGAAAGSQQLVPVFDVVQEGLVKAEGDALGATFRLPNALETTGAFSYVDVERFNAVPLRNLGQGRDEAGQTTLTQGLDLAALDQLKPYPDDAALSAAGRLVALAGLSPEMTVQPSVTHAELTLADERDQPARRHALDTTVGYQIRLAGLPVTGTGARLRITFAADGTVSQLSHALRKVSRAGDVAVISPDEAVKACAALYGPGVGQGTPTLGYQFPELAATDANGKGLVKRILPQYTCNPIVEQGAQAHRLVPAVPGTAPAGRLSVSRSGDQVSGSVSVSGGTAPYTYRWSSDSTVLPSEQSQAGITYRRTPRESVAAAERLTVEVTDANGVAATASVTLAGDGSGSGDLQPGGGGFGELAVGPTDVGIEQTVDEWQCAQDSANGFKSVMSSKSVPTAFDWRGWSAWEWDFKDQTLGGGDQVYVDNVDATWYTGHGWSGGWTFKASITDTTVTPGDLRLGDRDLEWLQLESCQVLRDTNGAHNYFGRWRQAFRGLHIMNGFHTNAYCINGGTGRRFAEYLFPKKFLWWTIRPAQRVRVAWALMAIDKEPNGVVYRSMGPYRWYDGANNMGDYFWGQGSVGPDLTMTAPGMGMWSVTGTV